jgi:apolipoprotein N-acyltransferase
MKKNLVEISTGLIFLILATVVGFDMNQRAEADELWGYETFFVLICFWLGILAIFGKFMTNLENRRELILASVASGGLLSLGFMFSWSVWGLFIGFVPLLWIENQLFAARAVSKTSYWTIFKLSYNAFVIWNICSTYWVANAGFIAGGIAILLNSFFMTLPFLAFHFIKKRYNEKIGYLAFISCWLSFEWWHLYWDLSWPWLTLGNSFHHSTYLVQWYEYTGVFGGSLWILVLNVLIFSRLNSWFLDKNNRLPIWNNLARPLFYLFAPVIFSLILLLLHNPNEGEKREVLALQPNYEPHFIKFKTSYTATFNNFYQLITENTSSNTDFIVFPETSFDDFNIRNPEQEPVLKNLDTIIKQFPKAQLIVGISATKIYEPNEAKPIKVGQVKQKNGEIIYYNSYNSAILLNQSTINQPLNIYHKSKLVPGSEIMPYIGGISFFSDLIMKLGGTTGYALTTQAQRVSFASPSGNVAPVICYESIYGDFVTQYIKKGAQVLFVMTNDGWWGDTHGYRQHLNLARLRAIETRRWVVRAANSGSSAFINSRGEIISQTHYNVRTTLKNDIYLQNKTTFYTRYGDLIGRTSLLLTLVLLVSAFGKLVSPSKKEVQQLRKENDL